jgi:hypothetical protein
MRWIGLNWDEGPFYQSRRLDLYKAPRLLDSGHAYPCFCTKDDLDHRRKVVRGRQAAHGRRCSIIAPANAAERHAAGEFAAIRFACRRGRYCLRRRCCRPRRVCQQRLEFSSSCARTASPPITYRRCRRPRHASPISSRRPTPSNTPKQVCTGAGAPLPTSRMCR